MARGNTVRSLLLATGIFAAGWFTGVAVDRSEPASLLPRAVAQTERPQIDPNILALMLGVASVAVDTESAALRINELTDRLAALERRVQQIEKPASK